MSKKKYVAALKRNLTDEPPDDWQDHLSQIEGVSILGASPNRVQFTADSEAAKKVQEKIGSYINLEEVADREQL
jgi:hypothetical protein